jgi:DnaK suppressor protein
MDKQQLQQALQGLGADHDYMSKTHYSLFRQHLTHNLVNQEESLKEAREQYRTIELGSTDPLDVATSTEEQERMLRRIDTLSSQIRRTQDALKSIGSDEYGYCVDCGNEIGLNRLIHAPFSRRDQDCATLHENKIKRETARFSI